MIAKSHLNFQIQKTNMAVWFYKATNPNCQQISTAGRRKIQNILILDRLMLVLTR